MHIDSMKLRKSSDRGHFNHGWLDSYHSFSFAHYYDPAYMGYSVLRVINEDVISPAQGFGMHSHKDMEIVTYMIEGALRHEDSMGNSSVIYAGDVQRMTAGTGVRHSEFNALIDKPTHFLQIWFLPESEGISPEYEEKHFSSADKKNQWCLIASRNACEGSLLIHQDIELFATILEAGHHLNYQLNVERSLYFQIIKGNAIINDIALSKGDAIAFDGEASIEIMSQTDAEILLFDLPSSVKYLNN